MSNSKIPQRLECPTCGTALNGEMAKRLMRLLDSYQPLMEFAHVFDGYMCGKCCNHDRKMLQDTHPVSLSVSTMPNGNSVTLQTDTLGPGGKTSCIILSVDVGPDTVLYKITFTRFVKPTFKCKCDETALPASASGPPASASGPPASASGPPASASGEPQSKRKHSAADSGAPTSASGAPTSASGAPTSASGAASLLDTMLINCQNQTAKLLEQLSPEENRKIARDERNYQARLRRAEQNKAKEAAAKELRDSREAAKLKQTEELRKSLAEGPMIALLAAAAEMQ